MMSLGDLLIYDFNADAARDCATMGGHHGSTAVFNT